jgi:hypothetical protein
MALYAATSAFRTKAEKDGATKLAKVLDDVARVLAPALTFKENQEMH